MRKFLMIATLCTTLMLLILPVSAQQPTIVDAAVATDDLSTLVAAVQAAGLVNTLNSSGPFTVFAPTNGAFNTLLSDLGLTAEQLLADTDLLTTVLLYHVVPGEVSASDIVNGTTPFTTATASGEQLKVDVQAGKVTFNDGQAIVINPDIQTSNGIVHIVDNVLLPPSVTGQAVQTTQQASTAAPAAPTIVGTAASISDFSTLVAAAEAAGLVDTLNGPGPFTVFAPTNGAFNTLLGELGVTADQLLADTDLLRSVLLYHVVPGEVTSTDILNQSTPFSAATAGGGSLQINVVNGKVDINNGEAIVTIPDIQTSNGVIHVIDNVLVP